MKEEYAGLVQAGDSRESGDDFWGAMVLTTALFRYGHSVTVAFFGWDS